MTKDGAFILSLIPRIAKLGDNYFVMMGIDGKNSKNDIDALKTIIENMAGIVKMLQDRGLILFGM